MDHQEVIGAFPTIDRLVYCDYNVVKENHMPVTSVRLSEEEAGLIRSYCTVHGISMSDALKRALIEKIEDEFDLAEYEAAKREYDANPVSHSLDEVREKLGLK